jgi:DNA-binding transcriptional MerR regulator
MSGSNVRADETYTIRQLCEEFGCTPRALRFYEDKAMLAPARDGLNRIYRNRDRVRLRLILQGKRVGLSLNEIAELLDLYDPADGGAVQMARSLKKAQERVKALEAQRVELEVTIADLKTGCAAIEKQLRNWRPDLLPEAAERGEGVSQLASEPV